jgi:Mrp family chromosome partitioning ATPase/capsular polysaccharide biosynthesis protein
MPSAEVHIKPLDIKRFVLHRSPLIVLCGVLLFALLAPLLLTQVQPGYRTETHLMLTPNKQPTLQGRERDVITGDLRDHMRTLSKRISSYNILTMALENLPTEEWPAFLDPTDPMTQNVYRLMSKVEAEEISGTYLLEVSIEAGAPKGLGPMLNSITESFLQQLENEQEDQYTRQLSYLREERERIMKNVTQHRAELVQLADDAGQRSFLHKTFDAHLEKLQLIQRSYWQVETDRIEKQRELDTVLLQNEKINELDLSPIAQQQVADNFGINRMELSTYDNLQTLRSSIDGLTPSNTDRQYVEMRMDAMGDYLVEYKENVSSNTLNMLVKQRTLKMDESRVKAEAAATAAEKARDYLRIQQTEAEKTASSISDVIFTAQEMIFNIDQLMARLSALDSRIDDNQLQAKAPLPMHVDRQAQTPELPFESNKSKLLIMAFILSFGFIGAGCFIFDLLDNRVRSRQDIERLLGGAIPDPVPLVEEENVANLPNAMRNGLLPNAAQAYRKLAVRLYREKPDAGARIYCLSGTDAQVGTSTMTVNLAECFAAYGNRVLLVDLNRAHPAPFWIPAHEGLASDTDFKKLIIQDEARNIDVLPAGQKQTDVLPATRLYSILDEVRSQYDWVLLDCAPLLEDDTAQLAAQHSDGVLLTVREDMSFFSNLSRAKVLLETFEIPAMTFLLNGAHSQPGEWLFFSIQSSLKLITALHKKIQNIGHKIKRTEKGSLS